MESLSKWFLLSKYFTKIWKSNLNRELKIDFFRATVETVLLFGCSTWNITVALARKLDGTYTRLLRAALNVKWQSHTTNQILYDNLPKVTSTIQQMRLFCGRCWCSKDEVVSQVMMWEQNHGKRPKGRPAKTFFDQLAQESGLTRDDLPKVMEDRRLWRQVVKDSVRLRTPR